MEGGGRRFTGWRRGPVLSWTALGGLLATVVLGVAGVWNPWHLTYVDVSFTAPFLWVAFLGGLGVLWHLHAPGRLLRVAALVGLLVCLLVGSGVLALFAFLDEVVWREPVANGRGDVEGELISGSASQSWELWLRADRGLLSRQHEVARIGYGDSGPPIVEARFVAPDELVITAGVEGSTTAAAQPAVEVYRVRFDREDLSVVEETCRPAGYWPLELPGCMS